MHNDDMYLNAPSFENIAALLTEKGYTLEAKIKHGFGDFDEIGFLRKFISPRNPLFDTDLRLFSGFLSLATKDEEKKPFSPLNLYGREKKMS